MQEGKPFTQAWRRLFIVLGLVGGVASCAGSPLDPDAGTRLEATGRLERGATIELSLFIEGTRLDPSEWTLEVVPEGAAEVDPSTHTLRPLQVGEIGLVATSASGGAELTLDVAAPPVIVFHKLVDGNRDIYTVALDGEDLQRLTTDPASDAEPTSNDGWIVFTSFRDGVGTLHRIPATGGEAQQLSGSNVRESQAELSAAGGRLAYIRTSESNPRLWAAGANGSGPASLTNPSIGTIEASPTWSPAGDRIAYVSTQNGNADIWMLTPGAAPTVLIESDEADVEPTWSPDGESIVFVSTRDGDTELYRYDLDTKQVTRLTYRPGSDGQPAYLPDGRIVYTARNGTEVGLYWMDPMDPEVVHPIPTGEGEPGAPAALR